MSRVALQNALFSGLVLFLTAGCNDFNNGFPVGGGFDLPDERAENEPLSGEDENRHEVTDQTDSWSSDRSSRPKRTETSKSNLWGADRSKPSDTMPSRTERWGAKRAKPSDSMPSKSKRWGADRPMPSDSMPSKTERWGKDRRMPSDSMPGKSFPRRPLPSETRKR